MSYRCCVTAHAHTIIYCLLLCVSDLILCDIPGIPTCTLQYVYRNIFINDIIALYLYLSGLYI